MEIRYHHLRLLPWLFLGALVLSANVSARQVDIFLQLRDPDILGESVSTHHRDWIELLGFSHGLSLPVTFGSHGAGPEAGQVSHEPLSFTKWFDRSSVLLIEAANMGRVIGTAQVDFVRDVGATHPEDLLQIKLTDVLVSSVRDSFPLGSERILETFTLEYVEIEWTYFFRRDKGGPVTEVRTMWNRQLGTRLAVEMETPIVVSDGEAVVFRWKTWSEVNNAGFEVQRQAGDAYVPLAYVPGAGTTTEPQTYEVRVPDLDPGTHTFRIASVSTDGMVSYSSEIEAVVGLPESMQLLVYAPYPNPFRDATGVDAALVREAPLRVTVLDVLGREVAVLHDGVLAAGRRHRVHLDGSGLSSGLYALRFESEGAVLTRAVTLVR